MSSSHSRAVTVVEWGARVIGCAIVAFGVVFLVAVALQAALPTQYLRHGLVAAFPVAALLVLAALWIRRRRSAAEDSP